MHAPRQADAGGLVVANSHAADPAQAVAEIVEAIGDAALAGGMLFCSSRYDRDDLASCIQRQLGHFPLIGCTSAGELTPRGYDTDNLQFIGFPAAAFTMRTLLVSDIDGFDRDGARQQIRHLAANARQESQSLGDQLNQVALFLVDGLSHREEILTITAQDALGDIPLIGGSSGDGLTFSETAILVDGKFHSDAAVIAIVTSTRPMHVFSENYYEPGPAKMVVTRADPEKRIVYEINAAPAAEEYRHLAGNPVDRLDTAFFAAHPPMVRTGGSYHVRSIQTVNETDDSLTFYCAVDNGIVMTVGQPVDRIAQLTEFFGGLADHVGEVDHVLCFDCVLNRVDAENRQLAGQVSQIYAANRVTGFNTYGEQFRAAHVNQTLSGLAIGR